MAKSIETLGSSHQTYPYQHNYKDSIMNQFVPQFDMVEYRSTSINLIENQTIPPLVVSVKNTFFSKQELSTFLDFMELHRGRKSSFWFYLRTTNFIVREDLSVGSGYLTCDYNQYGTSYNTIDRIWFERSNGDIFVRRVTLASDDLIQWRTVIYLTPSIEAEIPANEILVCGRVILCRFDIDEFFVSHKTNHKAEVSVRLIERPTEYPAT